MGAICPRRHCLRQWRRNWEHTVPMSPSFIFSIILILVPHFFPSESTKMRHPFHDRKIQKCRITRFPDPGPRRGPHFEINVATDLRRQRGLLIADPAHTSVRPPPETLGEALILFPSPSLPSFPFFFSSLSAFPPSLPFLFPSLLFFPCPLE